MALIVDIRALVRPAFDAAEFSSTKWETSDDKAAFANNLCRFIAADFDVKVFTHKLYARLSNCFRHIACFDKAGFIYEFFQDLDRKVKFLEHTSAWHPCGDLAWTYCDVEQAILRRLAASEVLTAYRAMRTTEFEPAEREMLRRLSAKYETDNAPSHQSVLLAPLPTKPVPKQHHPSAQTSLF